MTAIIALSGIKHIQSQPSLYIGGESSKTVLCSDYSDDSLSLTKIRTTKDYKLICEVLHNAFDNVRKNEGGNISLELNEDTIIIKNSTKLKVEDTHTVYGELKQCLTLDLILDTMFTSSNFEKQAVQTAGMFGIGLKVVIALSDFCIIELNDRERSHVKKFNHGELFDDILLESTSDDHFFSIMLPLTFDIRVIIGLAKEIASFNNQPVEVITSGYSYNLYIPSLDSIIQTYASNLENQTQQVIWLDDKIEIKCLIGYQSNASILLSNGLRSTAGSWLNVIMKAIEQCYAKFYQGSIEKSKLSVIGYVLTDNCGIAFDSNGKDNIVTRFKECYGLELSKSFFIPLQQSIVSKQISKAIASINLKKIPSYSPPIKKPVLLMILEGEGAKTSISYSIDRSITATFTTTGKIPNLDKSEAIISNPTVAALIKIIDLDFREIIIACDPDPDGYHIVGLLLNFLSRMDGMLSRVKVIMFPLYKNKEQGFSFREEGSIIKYFKGLGSYSRHEIADVMRDDSLVLPLESAESPDYKTFKLFFSRDSHVRKELFNNLLTDIKIEDVLADGFISWHYICIMLRQFMELAILRSIPAIDGLNNTKRKVIYGSMKTKKPEKVTVLCSQIASLTDYPHGEKSLQGVVIKMGQDFPCSNWIALMENDGAFGSRRLGGDDAASPRYLYTQLSKISRRIFLEEYDGIIDSEVSGEPKMYLPLYPLLLINGCNALGVGFRSNIPPHDPKDVTSWLIDRHNGIIRPIPSPKYNGFSGNIILEYNEDGRERMTTTGIMDVDGDLVNITEIPPTMTIAKMIDWLNENDYNFIDRSSPDQVDIVVTDVYDPTPISNILTKRIPIECKIVSYEEKIKILDFSREELFEYFYQQSVYFFDLLRERRLLLTREKISHSQSLIWCIKLLMEVEMRKIDKSSYLTSKVTNDMTWFDHSTIEIDYRVSQLTDKYLSQLSSRIDKLEDDIITIRNSSVTDLWSEN